MPLLVALALVLMPGFLRAETLTVPGVLEKKCNVSEDSTACLELGQFLRHTSSPAKADEFLLRGCRLQLGRACSLEEAASLGEKFAQARKQWSDASDRARQAAPVAKRADEAQCESGTAASCHDAGVYYQYLAEPVNPARAKALFERGCRLSEPKSCGALNLMNHGIGKVYEVLTE